MRIPLGGPRPDPVLDYIRDDAKALGMGLREYCREFGITYSSLWDWGVEDYDPGQQGVLSFEELEEAELSDESHDDEGWEEFLYRSGAERLSGDRGCSCFRGSKCSCETTDERCCEWCDRQQYKQQEAARPYLCQICGERLPTLGWAFAHAELEKRRGLSTRLTA